MGVKVKNIHDFTIEFEDCTLKSGEIGIITEKEAASLHDYVEVVKESAKPVEPVKAK